MTWCWLKNVLCNPVFLSEMRLRWALKAEIERLGIDKKRVLDLGCGEKQYQHFFSQADYVAIDVQSSGRPDELKLADIYFDGVNIPFESDFFDVILCSQVLEHAKDPLALMKEANRVCKSNGAIILSVPFVYPEHEEPYDFRRYSAFGVYQLAEKLGCRINYIVKDSKSIEVITVLLNLFLVNSLLPNIKWVKPAVSAVFCFPAQMIAMVLSNILRDRQDLYFNIVVTLRTNKIKK